jgi:hypothetical protein
VASLRRGTGGGPGDFAEDGIEDGSNVEMMRVLEVGVWVSLLCCAHERMFAGETIGVTQWEVCSVRNEERKPSLARLDLRRDNND